MHAPLVEIDVGLLADQVRVTTTNTLDLRQSVHDFAFAIDVSVKQTQDVLQKRICSDSDERAETPDWHTWNCWWASGT